MPPDRFWGSTPREILQEFKAASSRQLQRHNEITRNAWLTAMLYRAEKIPPLQELLAGTKAAPKRRSVEEQQAEAEAWAIRATMKE